MKQIAWLAVASALVLTGCVGTFASEAPTSGSTSGNGSDGQQATENLTIEVGDLEARWTTPANIEVTATVNGTVTEDGEPVAEETVRGVGTLFVYPWGPCLGGGACPQSIEARQDNFDVLTWSDGNFSTLGGSPFYFSPFPPPVARPHCTYAQFQVWGVAGRNDTVPYAEDKTEWKEICTQSHP